VAELDAREVGGGCGRGMELWKGLFVWERVGMWWSRPVGLRKRQAVGGNGDCTALK
jgi:hypothetical protein